MWANHDEFSLWAKINIYTIFEFDISPLSWFSYMQSIGNVCSWLYHLGLMFCAKINNIFDTEMQNISRIKSTQCLAYLLLLFFCKCVINIHIFHPLDHIGQHSFWHFHISFIACYIWFPWTQCTIITWIDCDVDHGRSHSMVILYIRINSHRITNSTHPSTRNLVGHLSRNIIYDDTSFWSNGGLFFENRALIISRDMYR